MSELEGRIQERIQVDGDQCLVSAGLYITTCELVEADQIKRCKGDYIAEVKQRLHKQVLEKVIELVHDHEGGSR